MFQITVFDTEMEGDEQKFCLTEVFELKRFKIARFYYIYKKVKDTTVHKIFSCFFDALASKFHLKIM